MPTAEAYLRELRDRVRDALPGGLVGVYAGGSWALGAYEPGRSDLDVAVVADELGDEEADALVAAVRHDALPCPARGLELVVYDRAGRVLLNLNTGARMRFRAEREPDPAERHWFALDRAVLRARGVALHGPPAREAVAAVPAAELRAALADSLRWHVASEEAEPDDVVLNACRALRWAHTGELVSKPEAGAWARDGGAGASNSLLLAASAPDAALVDAALAARAGDVPPDRDAARAFAAGVLAELP